MEALSNFANYDNYFIVIAVSVALLGVATLMHVRSTKAHGKK